MFRGRPLPDGRGSASRVSQTRNREREREGGLWETMKYFLMAAAIVAVGCSQQPKKEETKTALPVEYFHVDPATAASVSGKITYHGPKPSRKVISMDADAKCEAANGNKPVYNEPILTGKDSGLANAFVYVQAGLEGKKFEPPKEKVLLDQRGCMFVPHVVGIQAAQPLDVKNSDNVGHNIRPMPKNNAAWSDEQAPGAVDTIHKFARTEVMIPVKCNVHEWMHSWIGVVENPYFAVTGPDGAFELKNLPPGDYTIAVWHETLGTQAKQVHVAASQPVAIDFSYQ